MQSITITVQQLRSLIEPVLPFAGRDDMLPVLTGVHIESHGRWLVATTTDRFRVGMKRIAAFDADGQPVEWPEFEALIGTSTLRSILTTFKGPRYLDPELALHVEGEQMEVEASGGLMFARASIAYRLLDGEYPKVASILKTAMDAEETGTESGFNAAFMADFKAVGRTLTMKRGPGERDPIFITDGADFVGALMPRKMTTDMVAAPWDDIFATTTKADKPAKKTSSTPERKAS